jgi:hypothetical protein
MRRVPVHERQDPNQDFLPLPDVTGPYGRALFVYRHEVSADVWEQLSALFSRLDQAGGHERRGMMTGSQERLTDWERPAG